jgi:histone deacetylase complex subunit SAP18
MNDKSNSSEINREKVCPFLIRLFYRENDFNSLEEMNAGRFPSTRELHIYTWMDASLRELTMLIRDSVDFAKRKDAILNYSFIFPDSKGKYQRKEIGNVHMYKKGQDDNKTLHQLKFSIGDYIDISIKTVNNSNSNNNINN